MNATLLSLCDKLQKLHNMAARVITRRSYEVSANRLTSIRPDNLAKGRKKLKATLLFKVLNALVFMYVFVLFFSRPSIFLACVSSCLLIF